MDRNDFLTLLNMRVGPEYPYIQVPPMLEVLITSWFKSRANDFSRMYAALTAEYSPIENYDRKEDRTNKLTHSGTDTDTVTLGSKTETDRTGTETNSTKGTDTTVRSGTETSQLNVSAFDSDASVPRENTLRTPNLSDKRTPDLTDTRTPNLKDVTQNSGTDSKATQYGHIEDVKEQLRAHGNIGVTTNQQMIEAEMSLREIYNIYEVIIRMFEREFLSRVY